MMASSNTENAVGEEEEEVKEKYFTYNTTYKVGESTSTKRDSIRQNNERGLFGIIRKTKRFLGIKDELDN